MYSVSDGRILMCICQICLLLYEHPSLEDTNREKKIQTHLTVFMNISANGTSFHHYDNQINMFCLVQKDLRIFDLSMGFSF